MVTILMIGNSCKKAVEQQVEDVIKKTITDGTWYVSKFVEGGTDITSSYNGWVCKFNDDNTLVATKTSTIQTGTWQSNFASQTFSAQFSSAVGDPLQKLNGTWTVVSSTATKGGFSQTKNSVSYIMELTKN